MDAPSDDAIKKTQLFRALRSRPDSGGDGAVIEVIREMRQQLAAGDTPQEVLEEVGLEIDYALDLM